MITEVLLILLLYLILFLIWWRFRHVINLMADVENILNNDDFFGDTVDTPKESIMQHRKRERLNSVTSKDKVYLLGSKWTQEKVDKISDETINKTYIENRDVKKLRQYTENDPIIKDQMANLGCLLVCTFGNFLVPVLVTEHTVNNLALADEQDPENEGYESD